ncbi:MAG: DNA protecting protein DprA [Candidatus Harrisonbacteria bacterium RIFCSPLOWO2_02_FULL_41_13b]|uniref:DNA protecting protein DprA n=1 Tax=Candidatus Harrisonbacteria bacterium RIFCSPLOWO2_02_FULL_41_13b TaxID=1798409 RepID=A0A1G1ZRT2_9BACT|nr:MAG: DNA protecting protein DprA [Candidatus Harrisonbacteria bacterium RIFCSPHIGHO2_02_FULL_40_20]OGY67262.1 MAG: DNA protecting protein DprA [Candidatus Harrisonbacteria bacterium RIFCSPLOWO2_02_FULL_41_13b]
MKEKIAYNALNVFYKGDYSKLQKARKDFGDWAVAWDDLGKDSAIVADALWETLVKEGISLALCEEVGFPKILKEIPWAPFGLYWRGKSIEDLPAVGIVGTRRATLNGRAIAKKFGEELAINGVAVISGLALGIDSAAHEGVLLAKGRTIAVLAGGLDYIYPKQNTLLFKKILESGGTIVSEYAFGAPAYSSRFLERNRIISGLSLGIVVIEAPEASGALATAKFALDQNREVFVVPGNINQPNYSGSHGLIKAGACLVTSAKEVLGNLNLRIGAESSPNQPLNLESLDDNQRAIINVIRLAGEPIRIDKIQDLTKMEIPVINRAVSLLEIQGIIKGSGGNYQLS